MPGHVREFRMPSLHTLEAQAEFAAFRDARGWAPFHDPRSLALALCAEAGELAGVLSWQSDDGGLSDDVHAAAAAELGDVIAFALHLANALEIDLGAEVARSLETARQRFASLPPGTPSRKGGTAP